MALQLSLKIDELPVTGARTSDVRLACQALLGDIPPNKYIKGKMIYLCGCKFFFKNFLLMLMML